MTRTLAFELFKEMVSRPEEKIELLPAALLIALDEYPHLNIQEYLRLIDGMASRIRSALDFEPEKEPLEAVERINHFLFDREGFRGNTKDYYDPRNSYLNDVLDRRTGIPITLSLIYMEVAARLGLNLKGVGMPGHFLVKYSHQGLEIFIDAFNGGQMLLEEDCKRRLQENQGEQFQFERSFLDAVGTRQILVRMLTNLKAIYLNRREFSKALAVIEKIILVDPHVATEFRDRAAVHYQLNNLRQALKDCAAYLELQPQAEDAETIRRNLKVLGQLLASRN